MWHPAEAEAQLPPPVPLRVHFSDVVDKTWPELRTRFMALLPSLAPDSQILVTAGAGPCPSDTHLFVAGGAAITADNLRPAVGAGNLKGVILPHAGIPPGTRATLRAAEFSRVRLFNLHHNASPTAEIAITLMLTTSRRLVPADRELRKGSWEGREIAQTGAVQCGLGGTVLVVGFGEIGKIVARVCSALGMTVLTMRRSATEKSKTPEGYELHPPGKDSLHALLPRATHLMITCPLTDETRGLIGAEELALLPDLAVVVNVGRAEVVDEDAMWAALQQPVDGGGCSRVAYGSDVWWAEGLPTAAVKRGATVLSNVAPSMSQPPTAEEGVPVPGCGSASEPEPEPSATVDVFDSVERKFGSKYPMHELDNVVMTPHYGGGRGLPGVEPARASALGALIGAIVADKRWPTAANLEMGY